MRFFAIAATFAAVAVAQYSAAPEETCSASVTITVTETLKHTPSAPGVVAPTGPAPYPTSAVVVVPSVPAGTGYPSSVATPLGGTGVPSGTAAPSGTGASSAPYPEFTGAASSVKVGGLMAGVGAVVAMLL
ncbi:hypothetical protein T440DRAFT_214612 [Plenodomus tracheiphilus IPT5]|uniref:Uncharacterized protein n=1 Tax=Plenodomus tracheiphilus IPT5 TaxID=1408161 RepID=A0A6A7AYH9_9PLEO|nr:hypothetical protein T440DRAFT_214612 [Plenodomus tracheiphilus IPT5]